MPDIVSPSRSIASAASRHIMYAGAGAAITFGTALAVKNYLMDDGEDTKPVKGGPGRLDREEAKDIFSGLTGATTLLPLSIALICIGSLYLKNRALLGEAAGSAAEGAAAVARTSVLDDELAKVGVQIVANEGPKTKSLYTFLAGGLFGSALGAPFLFGGPPD